MGLFPCQWICGVLTLTAFVAAETAAGEAIEFALVVVHGVSGMVVVAKSCISADAILSLVLPSVDGRTKLSGGKSG